MQAQMWIGRDSLPMPKFAIGDAVVHWVDTWNSPDGDWYDELDPRSRFYWWYRGVVVGVEYDYHPKREDQQSPWIYKIRIIQNYDGASEGYGWDRPALEMLEHEIKRSAYTARQFNRPQTRDLSQILVMV